ncbi:patatin-like phospholipase family protein [Xylophilus sp. ASV27]|uniref:patatin-like phospholipase family protein n=1 Tax=Xylophilus sp. ASV27 TaxID=2795129 RepID=UPI0018ECE0E0|nr:patatin-like phospholipase family protein [Xylophilus sp. ASV27]
MSTPQPPSPPPDGKPLPVRPISLALQGGGAHGAFTWGVLDALLQDGRLQIDGISGTSAGAVNAVAVAQGFAEAARTRGDAEACATAAREALGRVWRGVAGLGSLGSMAQGVARLLTGGWSNAALGKGAIGTAMSRWMSPYQSNPLDLNPLRTLLEEQIDFPAIGRLAAPRVFVSATHVETGRAEVFHGRRLTLAAVMASACLPMVFRAVEINGEHYWDGGYSANPALAPLIDFCECRDIVLVQLNPLRREHLPQTPQEIAERVAELGFNASLLQQMRSIDFINRLIAKGALIEGESYKPLRLHRIDGGPAMEELSQSSKLSADPAMMERLFEQGQEAARQWLRRSFAALGVQGTVDIRRDYVGRLRTG